MYVNVGKVVRIIDGDTFDALVTLDSPVKEEPVVAGVGGYLNLGYGVYARHVSRHSHPRRLVRFRLMECNAPAEDMHGCVEATEFLAALIPPGRKVVLAACRTPDLSGAHLATVTTEEGAIVNDMVRDALPRLQSWRL